MRSQKSNHGDKVKQQMWTKFFSQGRDVLLAACDEEILGKTFKTEELDFEVDEHFYKEELVEINQLNNLICKATIVNLVGEKVVKEAIQNNHINEQNLIYFEGVPHAQIVRMK